MTGHPTATAKDAPRYIPALPGWMKGTVETSLQPGAPCFRMSPSKGLNMDRTLLMNYYLLDFSGTNADAPTAAELDALRKAGVECSHEYGMSFSNAPDASLDLLYNARGQLSENDLRATLSRVFRCPPRLKGNDPVRVTIREKTVKEELDLWAACRAVTTES